MKQRILVAVIFVPLLFAVMFFAPAWAFAIVAAVYLLVLLLVVINRRRWIERPLVRFLASMLM